MLIHIAFALVIIYLMYSATATIRENLALKEVDFVEIKEGFGAIGMYIHNKRGDILGTQASLVAIESSEEMGEKELDSVQNLANSLAIHLVGAQAMYMNAIPQEVIDKEREILSEAAKKEMEENAQQNSKQVSYNIKAVSLYIHVLLMR
uniref:Translation elongation factor EFTs/EF1B dimerisation domain-containing protein n=1 Tax=Aplanochytrium stocchinoi TaxID=215587 RepID=A0A7S3PMF8_9STRA|mmetsp:Transcript_24280/g.29621  ORF Transcript_24280/g.29621 Transcript_24280/m.29621 type:complete len:149 (+) Transcript_24280:36-482(+)